MGSRGLLGLLAACALILVTCGGGRPVGRANEVVFGAGPDLSVEDIVLAHGVGDPFRCVQPAGWLPQQLGASYRRSGRPTAGTSSSRVS